MRNKRILASIRGGDTARWQAFLAALLILLAGSYTASIEIRALNDRVVPGPSLDPDDVSTLRFAQLDADLHPRSGGPKLLAQSGNAPDMLPAASPDFIVHGRADYAFFSRLPERPSPRGGTFPRAPPLSVSFSF